MIEYDKKENPRVLVMIKLRSGYEVHLYAENNGLNKIENIEAVEDGYLVVAKCLNFDVISENEMMANGLFTHDFYPNDVVLTAVTVDAEKLDQYIEWRDHYIKLQQAERRAEEEEQKRQFEALRNGGVPLPGMPRLVPNPVDDDDDDSEQPN